MLTWGLVESAIVKQIVDSIQNMAKGYVAAYGNLPVTVDISDLANHALLRTIRYAPDLLVIPQWSQLRKIAWQSFGIVVREAHKHQTIAAEQVESFECRESPEQRIMQLHLAVVSLLPTVEDSVTQVLLQLLHDPELWNDWERAVGYKTSRITTERVCAYTGAPPKDWERAVNFLKKSL